MKIAMFTDSFFPQINGVVTVIANISKKLADRGHKVYIIAPKYPVDFKEFSYKNVIVKRVSSVPAWFYDEFRFTSVFKKELLAYLKKENIDIIHLHTPVMLGWEAIMIGAILDKPVVGTFHTNLADKEYLDHFSYYGKILQKTAWWYLKLVYDSCSSIICPTENTKEELEQIGSKAEKIVIPNGIDFQSFDNSHVKKVKEKYDLHGKNLLFIGRIAQEKNILYLLDCFNLILKKSPKTKLIMVGDGPQMEELKAKIRKFKIEDNVILTGRIKNEKFLKSSILGSCDIYVTASKTEVQSVATLEAQANGLVCVGIGKKGTLTLIKDKYNGFLVKDGDKDKFAECVLKLLYDEKLYYKMRVNTIKEAREHDLNKIVKRYEKAYDKVIISSKKHGISYKYPKAIPKLKKIYGA